MIDFHVCFFCLLHAELNIAGCRKMTLSVFSQLESCPTLTKLIIHSCPNLAQEACLKFTEQKGVEMVTSKPNRVCRARRPWFDPIDSLPVSVERRKNPAMNPHSRLFSHIQCTCTVYTYSPNSIAVLGFNLKQLYSKEATSLLKLITNCTFIAVGVRGGIKCLRSTPPQHQHFCLILLHFQCSFWRWKTCDTFLILRKFVGMICYFEL